jgi:hypothetical protein
MAMTGVQKTTRCAHNHIASFSVHLHGYHQHMTGIAFVAVGGVLALVLLAVLIGGADARAQREAWNRIARRRRELGEWERQLIRAAESEGCPACRLLRERGGLHERL